MQSRHLAPLGQRKCGEHREHSLARIQLERVAVHAVPVVGIEPLVDGRERRRGPGHGDPALDRRARLRRHVPLEDLADLSADRVNLIGGRRIGRHVPFGLPDRTGARGDVKSRRVPRLAHHELRAAAADVEHHRRLAGGELGGRSEEGEHRLLLARDRAGLEAEAGAEQILRGHR